MGIANLLSWLFSRGTTLSGKVARTGAWLVLGSLFTQAIGLVKVVVLGRLLSPADFGLMGVAVVISNSVGYFSEIGLNASLIQQPGDIRRYLNTAWTLQVVRCAALAILLVAAAPLAAAAFGAPHAVSVIRVFAAVMVIWSFTNPAVVYFRKELDGRIEVLWRLSGVLVGLIVAIPLALYFRSVWALVGSVIAAQFVETAASYLVQPYRPRFSIDWGRARELVRFGRWILVLNMLSFLVLYADSIFVGRVQGITALGLYQMAGQVALLITTQVGVHAEGVLFPAFAKLRDSGAGNAFLRALGLMVALLVPFAFLLALFARPLVVVVLGNRWEPIVPCVQVLAWAGVAKAISSVGKALLMATGKPYLAAWATVVQLMVFAAACYPLTRWYGLKGVAVAVAGAAVIGLAVQMYFVRRVLGLRSRSVAAACKTGAVASLPALAAAFLAPRDVAASTFIAAAATTVCCAAVLAAMAAARQRLSPPQV